MLSNDYDFSIAFDNAKKCAIITLEETIDCFPSENDTSTYIERLRVLNSIIFEEFKLLTDEKF
jgi:hypothetical protein